MLSSLSHISEVDVSPSLARNFTHGRLSEREVTDACLEYLSTWREESKVCGYQTFAHRFILALRE